MAEQLEMFPGDIPDLQPYDRVILIRTKVCFADNEYESHDNRAAMALRSMAKRGILHILSDEGRVIWARGPNHKEL